MAFIAFRQQRKSRMEDRLQVAAVAALIFMLMSGLLFGPSLIFRHLWIDIESMTVADHYVGEDPDVVVWRDIHRDFWGTFSVLIRRAETDSFVCMASPPGPFKYSEKAAEEQPLVRPLSTWLNSRADLQRCIENGFGPGSYYITACHFRVVGGLRLARRCIPSTFFQRLPVHGEPA